MQVVGGSVHKLIGRAMSERYVFTQAHTESMLCKQWKLWFHPHYVSSTMHRLLSRVKRNIFTVDSCRTRSCPFYTEVAFVECTRTVYVVPACLAYIADGLASEVTVKQAWWSSLFQLLYVVHVYYSYKTSLLSFLKVNHWFVTYMPLDCIIILSVFHWFLGISLRNHGSYTKFVFFSRFRVHTLVTDYYQIFHFLGWESYKMVCLRVVHNYRTKKQKYVAYHRTIFTIPHSHTHTHTQCKAATGPHFPSHHHLIVQLPQSGCQWQRPPTISLTEPGDQ